MAAQTIAVHVVPNAPKTILVGRYGDAIKIKVRAPAVEGRANEELIRFLTESLGLPRHGARVLRGEKSREKIVIVEGVEGDAAARLLAGP